MSQEDNAQSLAEQCAQHMFAQDKASQTMGMCIESIAPGCATVSMRVRDDMVNGHDICHGGLIFSLADSAFAFACNTHNRTTVAAGCTIDFLRPALKNDDLTAVAEVVHQGGRSGIYQVRVSNQEGDLVALFKGNSARIKGSVLP